MPRDVNRTHLAIDDLIRIRNTLIDGRGKRHDLEDRAGFVKRARGAVYPRFGIAVLGSVGIECRPVRDGQKFSRIRVLDNHGA